MLDDAGLQLVGTGTTYLTKWMRRKSASASSSTKPGSPLIVIGLRGDVAPHRKYVKQFDIKVAIHNHGPSTRFPDAGIGAQTDSENGSRWACVWTSAHHARRCRPAGGEQASRLLDMHCKDVRKEKQRELDHGDVGEGDIAIAACSGSSKRWDMPDTAIWTRGARRRPPARHAEVIRVHARVLAGWGKCPEKSRSGRTYLQGILPQPGSTRACTRMTSACRAGGRRRAPRVQIAVSAYPIFSSCRNSAAIAISPRRRPPWFQFPLLSLRTSLQCISRSRGPACFAASAGSTPARMVCRCPYTGPPADPFSESVWPDSGVGNSVGRP